MESTRLIAVVRSLDSDIAMSATMSMVDRLWSRFLPPALPRLPRLTLSKVNVILRLDASFTFCTAVSNSAPSSLLAWI
jgi:hypothetical protein